MTVWTRLPSGRGGVHHAVLPAIFRGSDARSVASLRAVEAMRTALAPGVCPVLRYSDERVGAFSGLVRSRFSGEQAEKGDAAAMKPRHL